MTTNDLRFRLGISAVHALSAECRRPLKKIGVENEPGCDGRWVEFEVYLALPCFKGPLTRLGGSVAR